jgi:hypothetical protein
LSTATAAARELISTVYGSDSTADQWNRALLASLLKTGEQPQKQTLQQLHQPPPTRLDMLLGQQCYKQQQPQQHYSAEPSNSPPTPTATQCTRGQQIPGKLDGSRAHLRMQLKPGSPVTPSPKHDHQHSNGTDLNAVGVVCTPLAKSSRAQFSVDSPTMPDMRTNMANPANRPQRGSLTHVCRLGLLPRSLGTST